MAKQKKKRFVFLSKDFYNDYPFDKYKEIEQKENRPYIQIIVTIGKTVWAIPLRSNINHPHVIWTDKKNRCGVDLSKAVPVIKDSYIDMERTPFIRQNEFDALRGKDYRIRQHFIKYVLKYVKAKKNMANNIDKELCAMSTLQYFEEYVEEIVNQFG